MGISIYKLKDIFTIQNTINFFKEHIQWFTNHFSIDHFWHICHNIKRFIECRDYKKNFATFICPDCGKTTVRPNTCKSKLCPTCGKPYSDNIAASFANRMINKKHRSILFSIPNYLWEFFIGNTQLLANISNYLYLLFKRYFMEKHKISHFGFSVFIHTFGRDLKFYPHLHIIITEGGFKNFNQWISVSYFHWAYFQNSYKWIISNVLLKDLTLTKKLKKAVSKLWKENSNIFFNLKGQTINKSIYAIKYLTRYLARAPIAEYRITNIENNNISFWYKDVDSGEIKDITIPLFKFIGRLLIQIPPKNFKMIRHYGIYARNINKRIKSYLQFLGYKRIKTIRKTFWREAMINLFNIDPLVCSDCGSEMRILSIIWNKKVYSFKT